MTERTIVISEERFVELVLAEKERDRYFREYHELLGRYTRLQKVEYDPTPR